VNPVIQPRPGLPEQAVASLAATIKHPGRGPFGVVEHAIATTGKGFSFRLVHLANEGERRHLFAALDVNHRVIAVRGLSEAEEGRGYFHIFSGNRDNADFEVLKEYRKKGVAGALTAKAIDFAVGNKPFFHLTTGGFNNRKFKEFFRKIGFRIEEGFPTDAGKPKEFAILEKEGLEGFLDKGRKVSYRHYLPELKPVEGK
jgi:GNAT superfamily N-acetyltransferase